MSFKLSLIIFVILSLNAIEVTAQRKKKKGKKIEQVQEVQPDIRRLGEGGQSNAFRPHVPEEKRTSKTKSKKEDKDSFFYLFNKKMDNKVEEFYERLEENSKRKRKIEKKMQHPQYSDFSYFGHKKKPKIRPLDKRKFCKECGIVH